jgi:hypothetical protein
MEKDGERWVTTGKIVVASIIQKAVLSKYVAKDN